MFNRRSSRLLLFSLAALSLFARARTSAQQTPAMGEVRLTADTQDERDSGVWIDGKYAGYVKELKGNRKIMLPAGEHEISIRQAGYKEFTKKVVIQADQIQTVSVVMEADTKEIYPGADAAQLRVDIRPKRAAVYVGRRLSGPWQRLWRQISFHARQSRQTPSENHACRVPNIRNGYQCDRKSKIRNENSP